LPSKEDHLEKARENQRLAESFQLHSRTEREWSVTIRFYAGVHYLQAYLETKSARTSTHSETRKKIRAMAELHDLEDAYNQLYNMSWNARYMTLPCSTDNVLRANDLLLAVVSHIQKLMPF
jgi:hypothetical protein